jgi:hypothetical protein
LTCGNRPPSASQAERRREHRPERDAAAEPGQVGRVADDAAPVVGRPRKRERQRDRAPAGGGVDGGEAVGDLAQAARQVGTVRRQRARRVEQRPPALDRVEPEAGAAGIEHEHDARVGVPRAGDRVGAELGIERSPRRHQEPETRSPGAMFSRPRRISSRAAGAADIA